MPPRLGRFSLRRLRSATVRSSARSSRAFRCRQFRVEQKEGVPVWEYLYKGVRLFHWDTPPEVDALVRDPVARAKMLAASPAGYTEKARLQGELQVYGVFPLALLGPDVGTIIFRTPE